MNNKWFLIQGLLVLVLCIPLIIYWALEYEAKKKSDYMENKPIEATIHSQETQIAYFAWGCFWCIESIFDGTDWVEKAISWYIGWTKETANYESIGSGGTQHREWVAVYYNPDLISYIELVEIFWRQIDPTDEWWQFADRWFQYTTAIYYSNKEEEELLRASKGSLEWSGKFEKAIATKILSKADFFEAEEYHQDYAQKQSLRYKAYEVGSWRAWYKKNTWGNSPVIEWKELVNLELPDFTDSDLKNRLTPLQYKVTQKNGTERAFSDWNYHDNKKAWIYVDVVDGTALYSSTHKYDSGTWWPSFWRSLDESHLVYKEDNSLFSKRTEVRSKNADSHLGHIFTDGPSDKWGVRHCINGASLLFIPEDKLEEYWYWKYAELF